MKNLIKLERFKPKDSKKTGIIIFTVVCVSLVACVFSFGYTHGGSNNDSSYHLNLVS